MRVMKSLRDDIGWVDGYIRRIRPYVWVRTEDDLLIKRPNVATRLNHSGALLLRALLDGASFRQIIKKAGMHRKQELLTFILAVKAYLEGNLDQFSLNPAVQHTPFDMKFSDFPVLSELAVTYRCNLRCRFCYAGCNGTEEMTGKYRELDTKALKELIRIIFEDAKVPSVSFTGGEPMLRPDIFKLVEYAHQLGMRVNLITNGTMITREVARRLKRAGLDSAQVSLEGTTKEVHDPLSGLAGSFEKTVNSIGYLNETGMHVHSNTTLNLLNAEDTPNLPGFVKHRLGLDKFSMNLVIPVGNTLLNRPTVLPYHQAGDWIEKIRLASLSAGVEFMWYSPVPMCMYNTITAGLGNKGCSACDGLLSVAPDGSVLPCASFGEPVGNLLEKPFREIWDSSRCSFIRDKKLAHEHCSSCKDFRICNGACPLYWNAIGFDELECIIEQTKTAVL
jgi:radical SAM protein with 4Fe4S-binding SPASM domain